MRRIVALTILGAAVLAGQPPASAAPVQSDWPSLNADAAQSNFNRVETSLTAANVLKLRVRWSARVADQSYPVVAGGRLYLPFVAGHRIHVRVVDATTGKRVTMVTKDALGGILVSGGEVYLAGRSLQVVNVTDGQKVAQIHGTPYLPTNTFIDPEADQKYVFAGYVSGVHSSIYAIDSGSNQVAKKLASTSAAGTIGSGRVFTSTGSGSIFYDEVSGRAVARPPYLGSNWFAGDTLAYTIAPITRRGATLIAIDGSGQRIWSHLVGPVLATRGTDWPHAVGPNAVYVQTFRPRAGVVALDPLDGHQLWFRAVPNIQRVALAHNLLFCLTYALGQPARVIVLAADTGKPIGGITLSDGFYAFDAPNGLMIANGMLYIRVVGPGGSEIIALGH